MSTWASEGIILKRSDLGEADKLLTIFTKNRGKIKAIAKGVRKINSRRGGNVEFLNHAKLFFAEGKSFNLLTEAQTISSFSDLKADLKGISYAYKIAEIVDRLFHDEQEGRAVFDLLVKTLANMDLAESFAGRQLFSSAFEVKILEAAGYRPQLFVCSKCSQPLGLETQRLSAEIGGVVGNECSSQSLLTRPISVSAIKVLRFLQSESFEEVKKLSIPKTLQKEIDQDLSFYLEYILEKSLNSADFISRVETL